MGLPRSRGDQGRRPGGRLFRLRRVTWKSTPSNQGCLLSVGLLLRRSTFTPVLLRGPAPNGHPCPDGALAASLRLGPLRKTCVQPAPKSRLAVTEPFVFEEQRRIKGRSKASRLKPVPLTAGVACVGLTEAGPTDTAHAFSGTGFSRECVRRHIAAGSVLTLASSRLKPVLQARAVCWWDRL